MLTSLDFPGQIMVVEKSAFARKERRLNKPIVVSAFFEPYGVDE